MLISRRSPLAHGNKAGRKSTPGHLLQRGTRGPHGVGIGGEPPQRSVLAFYLPLGISKKQIIPDCGVGILPAPRMGRVGTPIPQENLGCFLFGSPLKRGKLTAFCPP